MSQLLLFSMIRLMTKFDGVPSSFDLEKNIYTRKIESWLRP